MSREYGNLIGGEWFPGPGWTENRNPSDISDLVGVYAQADAAALDQAVAEARRALEDVESCAVCHGPVGVSNQPDAPHLAGQPAIYVARQLRAYRSGARPHAVMAVMAKPLTDDDIQNLAAWFSSIRIEATLP